MKFEEVRILQSQPLMSTSSLSVPIFQPQTHDKFTVNPFYWSFYHALSQMTYVVTTYVWPFLLHSVRCGQNGQQGHICTFSLTKAHWILPSRQQQTHWLWNCFTQVDASVFNFLLVNLYYENHRHLFVFVCCVGKFTQELHEHIVTNGHGDIWKVHFQQDNHWMLW